MRLHAAFRGIAIALAMAVACGRPPVTHKPPTPAPQCEIAHAPTSPPDTVTIALSGAADPEFAPWGRDRDEQQLFDHLYETLIDLDCLDGVAPGLARRWSSEDDGRRWSFEIDTGKRFWDGTPARATDVAASWQRAAVDPMRLYALIDSVAVVSEFTVDVYFREKQATVPRVLTAPVFAITKRSITSRWFLGTGAHRVVAPDGDVTGARTNTGPVLRFVTIGGADARDLLDRSLDVMVTTDPAVIGYAGGHREFETVALDWDKAYVLLSTSRLRELLRGGTVGSVSSGVQDGLARDAVEGDARGFVAPSWWDETTECEAADPTAVPPLPRGAYDDPGRRRVLYDSSDPVARSLAERIVALATNAPTGATDAAEIAAAVPGLDSDWPRTIAEGVPPSEFATTLRHGDDFAYVVSMPRRPPGACYGMREFIDRAPWLGSIDDALRNVVIPLVDTRPHAITRIDRTALVVDGYGVVEVTKGGVSE